MSEHMNHPSMPSAVATLSALLAVVVFAAPLGAQSREERQLMADVRILQEQNQVLQNTLAAIADAIRAVNARIDEQSDRTGRALADQKLLIDNLTNGVREIREKLDSNTVRLGTLSQEVDALRQGVQQLSLLATAPPPAPEGQPGDAAPPPSAAGLPPPTAGLPGDPIAGDPAVPPVAAAPPLPPVGTSPTQLWDQAFGDYILGQYDLAISGFKVLIMYFPRSERAADAQIHIGHAYSLAGDYAAAVEAYDVAIQSYPTAPAAPEAHYKKGIALKELKRIDEARASFEYVVKTYPDSNAAILARQQIAQPVDQN
jgi:tol-pal system protein YbgF